MAMINTSTLASVDNEDFSFERLQSRMAHYLNQTSRHSTTSLAVAIAGGGGTFLSTLSATPGASSLLAEGTIAYSREAFVEYTRNDSTEAKEEPVKYASSIAAERLAKSACCRSQKLLDRRKIAKDADSSASDSVAVVGLSCTSVLRSLDHRPRGGSRAFLSAVVATTRATPIQQQFHVSVKLARDTNRTRYEEDVFLAHCLLSLLEYATHGAQTEASFQMDGVHFDTAPSSVDDVLLHSSPDGRTTRNIHGKTRWNDTLVVEVPMAIETNDSVKDSAVRAAAEHVLSGNADVVMLVPNTRGGGSASSFKVLDLVQLPSNPLVVPGSFNVSNVVCWCDLQAVSHNPLLLVKSQRSASQPPHVGHTSLAIASADAMEQPCDMILFELSITNVDKPSLEVNDIAARLQHFLPLQDTISSYYRWGILLTDASLFQRKADILRPCRLVDDPSASGFITFGIGTDTLVRLLDPKYYNHSDMAMFETLRDMQCRFVVGGRLEQKRKSGEFVSGADELRQLPDDVQALFTLLPDFRVDLSSSELRAKSS